MRFRVIFQDSLPVEITGFDLMVTGERRISIKGQSDKDWTVDIGFCEDIISIKDDHARQIYSK